MRHFSKIQIYIFIHSNMYLKCLHLGSSSVLLVTCSSVVKRKHGLISNLSIIFFATMTKHIHDFLDDAKSFRWERVFETLTEYGPSLLFETPKNRWPVLHQAAYQGNAQVVRRLITLGADPKQLNRDGDTAETVAKNRHNLAAAEACKVQDDRETVDLVCAAEPNKPNKLRVKLIGKGFSSKLKCQFPRKLRKNGFIFKVPIAQIRLRRRKDTYFYAYIGPRNIEPDANMHVYCDDTEPICIICMDESSSIALAPCGHSQFCEKCAPKLSNCPLCKRKIRFQFSTIS